MIRIYMDWNVMSQMKAGRHAEFAEIVSDNEKFFKLYSTSHIGDIAASSKDYANKVNIDSDLELISVLTGNYCVFNTGKEVVIENRSPRELFDERTDLGDILGVLNIEDGKQVGILDDEIGRLIMPAIDQLKNQPIDDVFKEAFENPETSAQMKQFLPDLENNYTTAGTFNSMLNMFNRLNEKDDYKLLRKNLQQGAKINRDRLYDSSDPYKMIESAYQKLGIDLPDTPVSNEYAPEWYNELTNQYIKLDMHGYQEDQVSIDKGRKQTFRNTMEDAFHTAFATTCDFYITSDKKSRKKAKVIYETQRINSLVMTPDEFVEHYNEWLHFKGERFLSIIPALLKYGESVLSADGKQRTYFGYIFMFDYFNKMLLVQDVLMSDQTFFVLTKKRPTNNTILYQKEIEVLILKLLAVFGNDLEDLGAFQFSEIALIRDDLWTGRQWVYLGMRYHLRFLSGKLQLYIFFVKQKNETQER